MHERTATDAFIELTTGQLEETRGIPWRISRVSGQESYLINGISYCLVEVTFATGVQYGMEAFGEEAVELRKAVLRMKAVEHMPLLIAS